MKDITFIVIGFIINLCLIIAFLCVDFSTKGDIILSLATLGVFNLLCFIAHKIVNHKNA